MRKTKAIELLQEMQRTTSLDERGEELEIAITELMNSCRNCPEFEPWTGSYKDEGYVLTFVCRKERGSKKINPRIYEFK